MNVPLLLVVNRLSSEKLPDGEFFDGESGSNVEVTSVAMGFQAGAFGLWWRP